MMMAIQEHIDKSRLGRLLVHRGYITEEQLTQALQQQHDTGERLGIVLIRAGWVTEHQLKRTLRHQNHYRCAAALAAIVAVPLQPALALASPSAPLIEPVTASQVFEGSSGMTALSDVQMSQIAGQRTEQIANFAENVVGPPASNSEAEDRVLDTLNFAAMTFFPVFNFLESDVTISGVEYGPDGPDHQITPDGSVSLAMPERIEDIRMDNIRVEGSPESASMGNLRFSNVDFSSDSRLTIRIRP